MVGRYMAVQGSALPKQIKGCALVSGAFKVDFLEWWKYRDTLQRLIVPSLVNEIMTKYGNEMSTLFNEEELQRFCNADTYSKMITHGMVLIQQRSGQSSSEVNNFEEYKKSLE